MGDEEGGEKEKEKEKEKKKRKKDRKEKKKKDRKGKELNLEEETQDQKIAREEGKFDKNRKGRKSVTFADSYPFDPVYRDECVAEALQLMFKGLEEHIADKPFYPRYVAHAVARTVAQMIQMVCYSEMHLMENWLIEGGANDEWDLKEELELPPIDTWARAVIPMKKSSMPITFFKPLRSTEGQFKEQREDPDHESEFISKVQNDSPVRRASETNILAHKKLKKCDHCTTFDKEERIRRKTDSPEEIAKQKRLMVVRIKRRLSSMFKDQAMLNKILKAKGLLPPPKPTVFEKHPCPNPPYFETY